MTRTQVAPEQVRYARVLGAGSRIVFCLMLAVFALYYGGAVEPAVPLERLPVLWTQTVGAYLEQTGVDAGWGWMSRLPASDMLGVVVLGALALLSVACLLSVLPLFLARRDRVYAALVVAEIAVIALAASGVLSAGR